MSTRCLICREDRKGVVRGVYCHHDGYPQGVGALLYRCYRSAKTIDALIRKGDLSSLGPTPTRGTHAFGYDAKSDPDGENAPFVGVANTIVHDSHHGGVEWVYLWRGSEWFVAENDFERGLQSFEPLTNRLSGAGESQRIAQAAENELALATKLSLVLAYLYRNTELAWPFADSDYYRAMLKSLEKHGFMKGRKLTERGLDLAWHVMERYRMTDGIDPQEPEITDNRKGRSRQ